jgi:FkbM family methyltransferase
MRGVRTYCKPIVWLFLRFLNKTGLLKYLAFSVDANIMGMRLKVPILRGQGMHALPVGEPWGHDLFIPVLESFPGTFVDVGVNLGQTLARLRCLDRIVPYIGFEPNPACVDYSRELARLNAFQDSPIVPAGLADKDGLVELVLNNDDLTDSAASIVKDFRPGAPIYHRIPVAVMRFATAERDLGIGKLGVVKIDVEGSEREVLCSMEHRIRTDRPAIFLEILPVGNVRNTDRQRRQEDIESLFQRLDYQMIRIHNKGPHSRLELMSAPIGIHDDQDLSNFVVLPAERTEVLYPMLERAMPQK